MSRSSVEFESISTSTTPLESDIDVSKILRSRYASIDVVDPVSLQTRPFTDAFIDPLVSYRGTSSKEPVMSAELFAASSVRRVNVVGDVGVGKSMYCLHLAHCWASGDAFPHFDAVFLIPLPNLASTRYPVPSSLPDIVIQECLGLQPSPELVCAVMSMLADSSKVLWLLDGYDEIVGQVPEHLRSVVLDMMSSPNRVLTGRPSAMENTRDLLLSCDVEVEVTGLSDASIRASVSNADMLAWLNQSVTTWNLCHIPLNLVLLRHVFLTHPERKVLSQAQLYQAIDAIHPPPSPDIYKAAFESLKASRPSSVSLETATHPDLVKWLQPYYAAKFAAQLLSQSVGKASADDDCSWLLSHTNDTSASQLWSCVGDAVIECADMPVDLSCFDESVWEKGRLCFLCDAVFGVLTRRHHCRSCGRSTCDACSKSTRSHPSKLDDVHRVCDRCVSPVTIALSVVENVAPKLSVQLLEYLITNCGLNAYSRRVLHALTDTIRANFAPFTRVLNLCPSVAQTVVFEWPTVADAIKTSAASEHVIELPNLLPDALSIFPRAFPDYLERVWKSPGATSAMKAAIVAASTHFEELQWIVAAAAICLPSGIQDSLAAVLQRSPTLLDKPEVISACSNTYLTSASLRSVYSMRPDLFPWIDSQSGAVYSSSEPAAMKVRQLLTIKLDDADCNTGVAVNDDGSVIAVSNEKRATITLFALPSGVKIRTFGAHGSEPGQFRNPLKLCFTARDTLLIAEWRNKRVQEVTLTGAHVRFISRSELSGDVVSVTSNSHVIVVGQSSDSHCICVFDFASGHLLRGFGEKGRSPGAVSVPCGLQLSSDGRHILVADSSNHFVSIFTVTGTFIGVFSSHSVLNRPADVCAMPHGEIVVVGHNCHRVAIFSPDGRRVKQLGGQGDVAGQFQHPTSLALFGTRLYVLDNSSSRVQVFDCH